MARKKLNAKAALERARKQQDYINGYRKAHYRSLSLGLNTETQADVIEKLDSVPNKTEYIVGLIRADINSTDNE